MRRVLWIAASMLAFTAAVAQQTSAPADAPPAQPGKYVGVASCINSGCHGSTQPLNASRVLQNEYYTWKDRDRHSKAQFVLSNATSARIAKNMRLKTSAEKASLCLDCHATNVPERAVSGHIDIEDGIQCESCHGPASGWRDEHAQAGWTHEQSVARGMIDLRSVPTRGSLCLSCHLGTGAKEVDHELIASGHPILAFELDNYTANMPPHWTPNRDTHGVRAWATGQAIAFRDSLDNLSRHARGDKWPEFSDMSCYNCHHSLRTSQWRQDRGWAGRAGLPSWSPQHWAVLRLIVGRVAPQSRAQLDEQVQQLASRVARMNDRDGVVSAADSARKAMDDLIPRIDRLSWSESDVRAFMNAIADDGDYFLRADVHSAEQAALSLQALNSSLTRRNPKLLRGPTTRAIDDLFTELKQRDDYDPQRFAMKLKSARP
ncbi:MAG: hypothetical protein JOZ54_18945 [Acidobacteria bacterium]|nr:hypothetical protein [Acidobacteriota bacterium]